MEEFGVVSDRKMRLMEQDDIHFQGAIVFKSYSPFSGGVQPLSVVCGYPEILSSLD